MTLARATAAATTLALALLAGACGGEEQEADDLEMQPPAASTTPAVSPAAPDSASTNLAFAPVGGSTLAGEVDVEEEGTGTSVEVTIRNSTDGAVHKGHIHSGTCSALGPVVAPLGDVTIDGDRDGESDTTVALPIMTVMDGQHVVSYHETGGNPGAPVLCVAIPVHEM